MSSTTSQRLELKSTNGVAHEINQMCSPHCHCPATILLVCPPLSKCSPHWHCPATILVLRPPLSVFPTLPPASHNTIFFFHFFASTLLTITCLVLNLTYFLSCLHDGSAKRWQLLRIPTAHAPNSSSQNKMGFRKKTHKQLTGLFPGCLMKKKILKEKKHPSYTNIHKKKVHKEVSYVWEKKEIWSL